MSNSYRAPLADLEFLLLQVLDFARLQALPAFEGLDAQVVREVLKQGARFAEQVLAPLNAVGDEQPAQLLDGRLVYSPGFAQAYRQYSADGWMGLDLPVEFGGQGLPRLVQAAFGEMGNGANLAFSMLPAAVRGAARLLMAHGGEELAGKLIPALIDGRSGATIAITEPQAGSDVGRIQTTAVEQPDGSFKLTGTKIFISHADNDFSEQLVHLVLARTPGAAPGTRGLSLFLVPKIHEGARNGVRVARLEHKMGLKASPTCVLEFTAAHARRIGEPGRGLQAMFAMVNTMRLDVAVQGVAIGGAALNRALGYAQERLQGGAPDRPPRPIIEHPDVRRMLMSMRVQVEGLRALTLEAALQLDLGEHHPDSAAAARALGLAQWLLPICKACNTEMGLEVANLAVQVFGGHGYIHDNGVEQYVRDVRVGSIYEGTNGIQAIDLVLRKLIADGAQRCREFLALVREAVRAAEPRTSPDATREVGEPDLQAIRAAVAHGADQLERISMLFLDWSAQGRTADMEAGATAYLRLAGLVGAGWMWLRMASRAGEGPLRKAKRSGAVFYARYVMIETDTLAQRAQLGDACMRQSVEQWQAGY
ncbi:MAG: acyl-CoA dehydrogenase [Proteobacteria bacterium]|nr:acyl-CoA dehydrogenase [Pseudomonadota bacterium]